MKDESKIVEIEIILKGHLREDKVRFSLGDFSMEGILSYPSQK